MFVYYYTNKSALHSLKIIRMNLIIFNRIGSASNQLRGIVINIIIIIILLR